MKITCEKSDLLKGVTSVSKAVPVRTTMPILSCILIDATGSSILLTANDMELGIETIVEGRIEERGMIALDAKIFGEIVRKLPDNTVTMETGSAMQTLIACEKAKFTIVGKEGDEFSSLPYIEKTDPITISQFSLKEVIRQTIFSTADNENNRIMSGELFKIHENNLTVAALDGHRIAMRNLELAHVGEDVEVIVPAKSLNEISKILSGEIDSMVEIYTTPNHILFEFEGTRVVSRLIEGKYFDLDKMISNAYETKVVLNRQELINCIERASLLVSESDKKPIIMNFENNILALKIQSFIGAMNEEMNISMEGNQVKIGFNPRFLLDALRVIDEEEVTIYLINHRAPCFIKDEEGKYLYLILPVNFVE